MTMPSKAGIFEYWMNWLDDNGVDWGEPSCWACKKTFGGKYDIKNPNAGREEIIENWNRVPLQRCHIIPKQFGGSDSPSNLFLMCIDCHDKAPDTRSREAFLKWVDNQNWFTNIYNEVTHEIKTYEIEDKADRVLELLSDEKIKKEIFKDLGIHRNQRGKGTQIKVSTFVAAIYNYLSEQDKIRD